MKKTLLVSCILAALVTQGCGKKDAAQHLQDAQNFINKQEYPAAVIELKSALQQEPENAKVRLTLGQIYLQVGDGLRVDAVIHPQRPFDGVAVPARYGQDIVSRRVRPPGFEADTVVVPALERPAAA